MQRTAMIVEDGKIFITTDQGRLEAFDLLLKQRLWSHALGKNIGHPTLSVFKGVLFVPFDNKLACIDPLSGREKWQIPTEGSVVTQGTIHFNNFYVGTDSGVILCVGINGEIVFEYKIEGYPKKGIACPGIITREGYLFQPADDGRIYILTLE